MACIVSVCRSFELAVHKLNPRCKIFTFDHTITPRNVPPYVTFLKFGLSARFNPVVGVQG